MKKIIRKISITSLLLALVAVAAYAADPAQTGVAGEQPMLEVLEKVLWVVAGATLASGFFVLVRLNNMVMKKELEDLRAEQGIQTAAEPTKSVWQRVSKVLQDDVPIEEEKSILFDHAFDGIQELDNKLPSWWVWMFYLSIGFGVIYFAYYEVLRIGDSSNEKYEKEMVAAEKARAKYLANAANLVDENTATMLTDAGELAEGKAIFEENCVACHGPQGQGAAVGPNLADEYWIHGGGINNVFKTVKYGVPAKGMIAWQSQLNPKKIHQVSSYIWSLQGTNPDNPKEAQGELYKAEVTADAGTDAGETEGE